MYTEEDEARHLLAVATEDIPPGTNLLRGVGKGLAARRVRTRVAVAAGAAGAVAAGALTALTVSGAPSALAAVTAAATHTVKQSYKATMITSVMSANDPSVVQPPYTVTGEFAPARGVGEENGGSIRFLHGYQYVKAAVLGVHIRGKSWIRMQRPLIPRGASAGILVSDPIVLTQFSPQDLLALLNQATTVRETGSASGHGWTGTAYAFSGSESSGTGGTSLISGTLDVDEHGRIRRLDATITQRAPKVTIVITSRIAFGNFGVAVSVTAPPASKVFTPTWRPAIP